MSESQIEFLQRQVINLNKENHLLKEDILAFHHFLNNRVKELKSYLRDVPNRYLNMELCDITQALQFVKEDAEYYQLNINALQHEIKQLKNQCAELKQLLLEQKDKYQQQQQNIETNLTEQYSKALKELQENLTLATSNCQIYRNSMNLLAQEKTTQEQQIKSLSNEIQKLKKQHDGEKNELQMIIARGKSQLSELEKAYTIRLHKVQQSNFEEYQTKLKNQAKDINEKDQMRAELEKKISSYEKFNQQLQQDYETILNQQTELQEIIKKQLGEVQVQSQLNYQLQDNSKQQESIISDLKLSIASLKDEMQMTQQVLQQKIKDIELQKEIQNQILLELSNIGTIKIGIMKQSSAKSQILEMIKLIKQESQENQLERKKLNDQVIKLQDNKLQLQEEQSQLIFQNEIFQQKISQLQDQIVGQQEFEIKYRKLVNEIVYLAQTDPKIIKSIQKQISIDFYKEYTNLNKITENDQNRPLFLLANQLESIDVESDSKPNKGQEDKLQQDRLNSQMDEIKSLKQFDLHESDQNLSFQWKNSIRMTLTPSLYNVKQEDQTQVIEEFRADAQTQTDRKKYMSKFLPHDNLDEIVEEIKQGYLGYIDTSDIHTQTDYSIENKSTQTAQKKRSSTNESKDQKQQINSQQQTKNIDSNLTKQFEVQQSKILSLNKIISDLELQLKESLFLNDKYSEDFELKSRELQRLKELSKNQLQDQMVDYENKLETQSNNLRLLKKFKTKRFKSKRNQYMNKKLKYKIQKIKQRNQMLNFKKETKENLNQLKHYQNQRNNLKQIQNNLQNKSMIYKINLIIGPADKMIWIQSNNLKKKHEDLKEQIQNNFAKIEYANEIVKYLQIEVENYKKQYNLFSNHKPSNIPKKRILFDSTLEDEKSIVFDSKQDFLPTVTNRDQFNSTEKNRSQRGKSYRLSDFEIKQHTTKHFFKNAQQTKNNLNKTQLVQRPNSPSISRNTKYLSTMQKKFNNPFENDCILHNAEILVENIKGNTPKTKYAQKSNDQFFLKGQLMQVELNSTTNSNKKFDLYQQKS
ncbi:unnamed protein product (macronuclear) [Paramecium tetraurelia]|uniref:Uncharacterized protein n=1 Tax=Paramecium tetraurelia TaxID=5888 RepID=A0CKS2_PARTE|nr:uncharacterized protein GSPATT00001103001 [Paramecium tetraurelia]CAK71389.1 unnamed protein product [Paramecium tetraurelia]|eukprot:XP_001438786.1 hypothetical protein (macronuclear) [Paramecium tetraurelia strain d4-2]